MSPVLAVARYRLRATFRRRAPGLLAIVVLIALLGGIAMAALAGGRRNQSAYPEFLASTHPSDLTLPTSLYQPPEFTAGYSASVLARIARLPHVRAVESAVQLNNNPLPASGKPFRVPPNFNPTTFASVDGYGIDQDRITVTRGRMVDPRRVELVVSADGAEVLAANGIHLGDTVRFAIYTNAELAASPDPSKVTPYRTVRVHFVGIGIRNDAVIHDDVDRASSSFILFTPVVTRPFLSCCAQDTVSGLRIDGGPAAVASVEAALVRIDPRLSHFSVAATDTTKIESAVEPQSIAYSGFGLIAAIAALLIAGQVVGRQLRFGADDRDAMRALGAGPGTTVLDALVGVTGAIVLGALLAGVVAVALSPLSPIGPVRRVYPARGLAFDWTVLGAGMAVIVVVLSALALALAYRNASHRVARRARMARPRAWRAARATSGTSLPVAMATGIRFAVEPGADQDAVPVRSVVLGAVLAIVVVVASLTFGSSLAALVSHPRLYGWNWTDELSGGSGVGAIPQRQSDALLRADPDVASWSGVYFANVQLDGVSVPIIAGIPGAAVQPPLLSGHGLDTGGQIVLGSVTLAQLHKHVGDTVVATTGAPRPTTLRIVGTATLPAVGGEGNPHTTLGVGALLSAALIPPSILDDVGNTPAGPNAIFVRLRPAADPHAALLRLDHLATELSLPTNYGVAALTVQRPAEIVNYRSARTTPTALGAGLAFGAIAALALTLLASVRRRRRELALLKTLGFTRRQLASVVAWQASVAVAIGVAIGVPVGIVVGRALWNVFAHEIHAVPDPTVPTLALVLVALGALVLANVVATIPGRRAARTPTALLLRAE